MRHHQRVSVTSQGHQLLRPLVVVLLNVHSNAKDTWKYEGQGGSKPISMWTLTLNGPQESSVTDSRTFMDLNCVAFIPWMLN